MKTRTEYVNGSLKKDEKGNIFDFILVSGPIIGERTIEGYGIYWKYQKEEFMVIGWM